MFKAFFLFLSLTLIPTSNASDEVEIGGLLLDNTISRLGHEFAFQFGQLWQDIPNTQGINVQIKEYIVPRAGTRLTVQLNSKIIYVTHMGRRQASMKQRVQQAVFILIDAMARVGNNLNNPDMANDGW
jgi:curli production assembly/transport component CsgE